MVEAEDGLTALEQYFVQKPGVVILDLVMKGMYGLDVLAKLREMDPAARVIVVSADIQTSSREMVEHGGGADFLNKPVQPESLARGGSASALRGAGLMDLTSSQAGRAQGTAEHRLRPRGRFPVAADRPPGPARGARRIDPPDRAISSNALGRCGQRRRRQRPPDFLRAGRRRCAADPQSRRRRES